MKKVISLVLVVSLLLCGCGAMPQAEIKTHTVTDHAGFQVEVPEEVNRIVVVGILPLASVLTVFFDSGDKIVGMPDTCMNAAQGGLLGELYPEVLDAETGFVSGSEINLEELMKLQPDVVFYNKANPEMGEQMRQAGFCALAVSVNNWQYDAIETLNQWIALLNQVIPNNEKAEKVAKYSQETYDLVRSRVADIPDETRQQALFLYKYSDTTIMTSGAQFFGQYWADAIGAVNVGHELATDNSVTVNMEQIYDWNPSLIFITNFTSAQPEDLYNGTVGNYDWTGIDAIDNQQVYKMPLGMYRSYTPGVDTPITLLWLAKTAYPDLFTDIDILAKTQEYYKEVFGLDLSQAQAASIFAPAVDAGSGF